MFMPEELEFKNDHDALITLVAEFRAYKIQDALDKKTFAEAIEKLTNNVDGRLSRVENSLEHKLEKKDFTLYDSTRVMPLITQVNSLNGWRNGLTYAYLVAGGVVAFLGVKLFEHLTK